MIWNATWDGYIPRMHDYPPKRWLCFKVINMALAQMYWPPSRLCGSPPNDMRAKNNYGTRFRWIICAIAHNCGLNDVFQQAPWLMSIAPKPAADGKLINKPSEFCVGTNQLIQESTSYSQQLEAQAKKQQSDPQVLSRWKVVTFLEGANACWAAGKHSCKNGEFV